MTGAPAPPCRRPSGIAPSAEGLGWARLDGNSEGGCSNQARQKLSSWPQGPNRRRELFDILEELSWLDWALLDTHGDIHRFVQQLLRFRLGLSVYREDRGFGLTDLLQQAQIRWHGVKLDQPDWGHNSHSLAFTVRGSRGLFHLILNAYWEPLEFELTRPPGHPRKGWQREIDTFLEAPDDFCSGSQAPEIDSPTEGLLTCIAQPRSAVLFGSRDSVRNRF